MKLIPEREKFIELLGDLNDDIEKSMLALPPHLQEIHKFLVSSGFKINVMFLAEYSYVEVNFI